MATTFSSLAMRAAAASACLRPSSERCRPRARPGNFTPVVGVRPWRTRRTMVEDGGFLSFIVRSGTPPYHLSPREASGSARNATLSPSGGEGIGCLVAPPHPALPPFGGEGSRRPLSLPEGEGWGEGGGATTSKPTHRAARPASPARCAPGWRGPRAA